MKLFGVGGHAVDGCPLPRAAARPVFPILGEGCGTTVVTKAAIEVRREPHLESVWVVFGLELDEVEPPFVWCELHGISGTFNSTSATFRERVPYCGCISFCDEGYQLVPTRRLPVLDWLNADPFRNLEDGLFVGSEFIREFGYGDELGRPWRCDRIRVTSYGLFSLALPG